MIKVTIASKVPGHRNGAGPHWIIHFSSDQNYGKVYHELRSFAASSFTPGENIFIKENSISAWDDGCHFWARVYQDKDAMLLKLVYG